MARAGADPDGLDTPLAAVPFCVLDLETTGTAAWGAEPDGITEIGIVKVQGGVRLGTLHTLVHPGGHLRHGRMVPVGCTTAVLEAAPRIEAVLAPVVDFVAGSVVVGHNVRFDLAFLTAALGRAGWPALARPVVDTLPLARHLLAGDVTDCRLSTLAAELGLDHHPTHRALDDALATGDLLHVLLERAAAYAVHDLGDLLAAATLRPRPLTTKLRLTRTLARAPGVYSLTDAAGQVLHVGRTADVRDEVRRHLTATGPRAARLLRDVHGVHVHPCRHPLEAAVTAVRLRAGLASGTGRGGHLWRRYAYVALTVDEAWPRLAVVGEPRAGAIHLGPFVSRMAATRALAALQRASGLRRCSDPLPGRRRLLRTRCRAGTALCPCTSAVDARVHSSAVATVRRTMAGEPTGVLARLAHHVALLAAGGRYEEAAVVRDDSAELAAGLARQYAVDALRRAPSQRVTSAGGAGVELRHGVLVRAWGPDGDETTDPTLTDDATTLGPPQLGPLPRELADELWCVVDWLAVHAGDVHIDVSAGADRCAPAGSVRSHG